MLRINFEVTYRCNCRCSFCYLLHTVKLNNPAKELKFEEIKNFIDTVPAPAEFYITGGEPFIRRDCCRIIEHIKSGHFGCGINTNGTLLNKVTCDRLVRSGIDYIIFSLHGPEKLHDYILGRIGAFKSLVNSLKYILSKKAGVKVILSCTINPDNIPYLEQVYLTGKNIGVNKVLYEHLQFLNRDEIRHHNEAWVKIFGKRCLVMTPIRFFLPHVDIGLLMEKIKYIQEHSLPSTAFEIRPLLSDVGMEAWYNRNARSKGYCDSIYKKLVIAPNGDVRVCQLYNKIIGNVTRNSLKEIVTTDGYRLFNKNILRMGGVFPACVRCCHRFKIKRLN